MFVNKQRLTDARYTPIQLQQLPQQHRTRPPATPMAGVQSSSVSLTSLASPIFAPQHQSGSLRIRDKILLDGCLLIIDFSLS